MAPGARILDLGCGPGFFTDALAHASPGAHVVGCDLQIRMVELTRARAERRGRPAPGLIVADARALPFRDGAFAAACMVTVLGEIPRSEECVVELARVLAFHGVLAVSAIRLDADYQDLATVRGLLEPHGFALRHRYRAPLGFTALFVRGA